ncbi:rod shape-determining protein RodA [Paraflavitalea speifideaquila]|uniref:rod shape-determining protein RodA n=1 Tax=Paraflavitalea speifideaquila TaxID=3076558 RepID=UPI0028E46602|nr:rod shape-determining protein RodA [Paraflavitalea speifideiaquila]
MSQRNPAISKGVDWVLIWLYLALVAIGLLSIFSVTWREGDSVVQSFIGFKTDYSKQFYFFLGSLTLGLFILLTDSKFFTATANIWYAVGIFLLLLVFPFHTEVKGTESIIRLGGFNLQPAELMKVFVNLALAKYLSRVETDFSTPRSHLIASAIILVPAAITIAQKETGLALVFFAFFLVMFREGFPAGYLIAGFSIGVLVVATLLVDKIILALVLSAIAVTMIYFMRKQIKRQRKLLLSVIAIWGLSIITIVFVVPFLFTKVLQKHQVERIFSLIGKENPYAKLNTVEGEEAPTTSKKTPTTTYVKVKLPLVVVALKEKGS